VPLLKKIGLATVMALTVAGTALVTAGSAQAQHWHGYGGGGFGLGFVGGLAAGAVIGGGPYYGGGYYGGPLWWLPHSTASFYQPLWPPRHTTRASLRLSYVPK
jgi:hypothetical protein